MAVFRGKGGRVKERGQEAEEEEQLKVKAECNTLKRRESLLQGSSPLKIL